MSKKTLITFGDVLNPKNGYLVRTKMFIDKLIDEGNDLTVIQFDDKNKTVNYRDSKIISCKTVHESKRGKSSLGFNLFREIYFQFEQFIILTKKIKYLRGAKEIYIEGCLLFVSLLYSKLFAKIVLDTHCINQEIGRKLLKTNRVIGSIRFAIWTIIESICYRLSNRIIVVAESDKNYIIKHFGLKNKNIEVIENKVESADFDKYADQADDIRKDLSKKYKFKKIALFIGDLSAVHNLKAENFIRDKLSTLSDHLFIIVGNNPNNIKNTKNVIYTGFVDSVDPYIILSDICIAPLETGSGTKTKILDYIKYDKKIVATEIAMEGIEQKNNIKISDIKNFKNNIL